MWIILNESRKISWRIWSIYSVIIVLIMLLQSINGKLEGAIVLSWFWTFVNIIPGLAMIQWSMAHNRYPEKVIPKNVHITLWLSVFAYLSLALFTLLAEGWATQSNLSLSGYRLRSFCWLVPIQGLLIRNFYILFYKKESKYKPGDEAIVQLTKSKAQKWSKLKDKIKSKCVQLIAEGKVEDALEVLRKEYSSNRAGDGKQVITWQSQLAELEDKNLKGLITREVYTVGRNNIKYGVLNILE